jgi:hypothetical protein
MKKWLGLLILAFLLSSIYVYADGYRRGSGFNDGVLEMADYPILFDEANDDPGIPSSDSIQLYAKDKEGVTTLYTQDSTGTVKEIGASEENDPISLHLDQSEQQTISGGLPFFADGIISDAYFYPWVGESFDQKQVFISKDGTIGFYYDNGGLEGETHTIIDLFNESISLNGTISASNLSGTNTGDRNKRTIMTTIDGNYAPPAVDEGDCVRPAYSGTITGWYIDSKVSGSIVVDVKKNGSTIAGTEKPTLSSATSNSDNNLTTWTTSLTGGDQICFEVDSASTLTKANVALTVEATT